jgi:hypothetical protein
MLKKALALLMLGAAFSTPSWADWDRGYGRVIRVEPAISFGFHDGRNHFHILYEFGGDRYWTYADYYPGPWIAVPAPGYGYRYGWDNYYYPYRWDRGRQWGERHWRHHGDRDDHHGRRFDH